MLVTVSDTDAELDSDGENVGEKETLKLCEAEPLSVLEAESEPERDSDDETDVEAV